MPGVGKKADAVADRSGVPLLYNHVCLHQGSPTRRERRAAFPGSQVFGTGTLPVGVQGRSALLAPKERNPDAEGGWVYFDPGNVRQAA